MLGHMTIKVRPVETHQAHLDRCTELRLISSTEDFNGIEEELLFGMVTMFSLFYHFVDHHHDLIHQRARTQSCSYIPVPIFEELGKGRQIEQGFDLQQSKKKVFLQSPFVKPHTFKLLRRPLATFSKLN